MLFISFEGLDGSGKSTQALRLRRRLEEEGYDTLLVREPGGTELSEKVRDLLLDAELDIEPFAELLLFSAARAQLVSLAVKPALDAGKVVICDRFFDSTTAYQGSGRGIESLDWMQSFHRHVTGGLVPDRTYYCRLSASEAADRRGSRADGADADRMEGAGDAFFDRVARAYDEIAASESSRYHVLDAGMTIEAIEEEIWEDVSRLLHLGLGTAQRRSG